MTIQRERELYFTQFSFFKSIFMSNKSLKDIMPQDQYATMEDQVKEMKWAGFLDLLEIGMVKPETLSPQLQDWIADMVEKITNSLERKNLYKSIERAREMYTKEAWDELMKPSIEDIKSKIRLNPAISGLVNSVSSGVISFEDFSKYTIDIIQSPNPWDNPVVLLMAWVLKTKISWYDFVNNIFKLNLNPKDKVLLTWFPNSWGNSDVPIELVSIFDMIINNIVYQVFSYANNQVLPTNIPPSQIN